VVRLELRGLARILVILGQLIDGTGSDDVGDGLGAGGRIGLLEHDRRQRLGVAGGDDPAPAATTAATAACTGNAQRDRSDGRYC